jgi:GNAT superfamily N-acetyltransferase
MKTSTITENRELRGWDNHFKTGTLAPLRLLQLQRSELEEAARLLGRGMCDNPANIRAFGIPDAERRSQALVRFFGPVLRGLYERGLIWGAFRDGTLVGVCGMARPGLCQPSALEKLRVVPSVAFGNPVGTPLRVLRWVGEWARRDPSEPHWHLGPVAVDSHLHGQGIGGAMLAQFCGRMDNCAAPSYLETDKIENVRFYQKFGFTVVAEARVLGVRNWFMSRPPRMASANVRRASGD